MYSEASSTTGIKMAKTIKELTDNVDKLQKEHDDIKSQFKNLAKAMTDKKNELIKAQGRLEDAQAGL